MKKVLYIVGGIILVIIVIGLIAGDSDDVEDSTTEEELEPESEPEPIEEKAEKPTQPGTAEVEKEEVQLEPEPKPEPDPEPEPEWVEVIDFTARDANKQSETFTLLGGKQKLAYTISGDEQSEGMCLIYVMDEGTSIMESGGIPVVWQDGNTSDDTLMRKSAGDYYLDLQVGWGSCAVEIFELR
jgi:hypothetical protein